MLWNIAAPFFIADRHQGTTQIGGWIDDFCVSERHSFHKIAAPDNLTGSWHARRTRASNAGNWAAYWEQSGRALRGADGIVTVFPQLAAAAAVRQTVSLQPKKHLAWCFNIGRLPDGLKKLAMRQMMKTVSCFVVHSNGERRVIADYLDLPLDRVRFVPLQRAPIPVYADEDRRQPFIVAMGSANRDYATLVGALAIVKVPAVIVAAPRAIAGLELPPHVKHIQGLSPEDCHKLAQRARFSVVPLVDTATAAGQVTVIESLRMGRAVIASRNVGTVDYIQDQRTGILVPPNEPAAMAEAIARLWDAPGLANDFGARGGEYAERELSDDTAARRLVEILDDIAGR